MGIFSAIMNKLRHHGSTAAAQPSATSAPAQTPGPQSAPQQADTAVQQQQQTSSSGMQGSPQAAIQDVDVEAVLQDMASRKGGGGNYRQSIVDLLKLLDLDSSLNARKELAEELDVHAGAHGSAEQNVALHKAVMRKIAENGGKVPESLRD